MLEWGVYNFDTLLIRVLFAPLLVFVCLIETVGMGATFNKWIRKTERHWTAWMCCLWAVDGAWCITLLLGIGYGTFWLLNR